MRLLTSLGKVLNKAIELHSAFDQPNLGKTYTTIEQVGAKIHYAGCKMYQARQHTWKKGRRLTSWSDQTDDKRIGTVVGWVVIDQVADGVLKDVDLFVVADRPADVIRILKNKDKQ